MATWTKFLESKCEVSQKFQKGDIVLIEDGTKSIKSSSTIEVEIVNHEYLQIIKNGIHGVINSYDLKFKNGYIHTNFPEYCIIKKIN